MTLSLAHLPGLPASASGSRRNWRRRRARAWQAALGLGLYATLVTLILLSVRSQPIYDGPVMQATLVTLAPEPPPPPKPLRARKPPPPAASTKHPSPAAPRPVAGPIATYAPPPIALPRNDDTPGLDGFRHALRTSSGCSDDDFLQLTPAERATCRRRMAIIRENPPSYDVEPADPAKAAAFAKAVRQNEATRRLMEGAMPAWQCHQGLPGC